MSIGRAIAIGECMVELARGHDGRFGQAFGGDTFNTAVYLARAGVPTAYATALGDDPYSAGILRLAAAEGIDTSLVSIRPQRMPGLYLIETSSAGERTFYYWRDRAPARELPDSEDWPTTAAAIAAARLVYISGITLSLYSPSGLDRFAEAIGAARSQGALIAMDGNYRPRGWGGDVARARATMDRFWRLASIALPTFDDEAALWGDRDAGETVRRLTGLGLSEIAVKRGADGAVVWASDGSLREVPVPAPIKPLDTTAAGDSFNAAYLAARLAGRPPDGAAVAGHRLAGVVIAHRGAIVPSQATASALRY
jgi:2-dehydro-3-deoxygluconokinase